MASAVAEVDAIAGHRDWLPTECPGNAFHPTLPDLRREVAGRIGSGIAAVPVVATSPGE